MACFLEYKSSDAVTVHDLVYVRGGVDEAEQEQLRKLRLGSSWATSALRKAGFTVTQEGTAGRLLVAVAQK